MNIIEDARLGECFDVNNIFSYEILKQLWDL